MKSGLLTRTLNYVCALLMLAVLILQFVPFWNCSDCKTHKDADRMVSIAEYVWLPEHHKPITKDLTNAYLDAYGEDYTDENGKAYKFAVDDIVTELVIAFAAGVVGTALCIVFSKKVLPILIPLVGGVATMISFLFSPAMPVGQNWMLSLIVAGICVAVSATGLVVGFVGWAKVRGQYYRFPTRMK